MKRRDEKRTGRRELLRHSCRKKITQTSSPRRTPDRKQLNKRYDLIVDCLFIETSEFSEFLARSIASIGIYDYFVAPPAER